MMFQAAELSERSGAWAVVPHSIVNLSRQMAEIAGKLHSIKRSFRIQEGFYSQ